MMLGRPQVGSQECQACRECQEEGFRGVEAEEEALEVLVEALVDSAVATSSDVAGPQFLEVFDFNTGTPHTEQRFQYICAGRCGMSHRQRPVIMHDSMDPE
jgi:hypothetical protein